MSPDFADRVAVITGGAGGIGRETALRLSRRGARIHIVDKDEDAAAKVVQEIESSGGSAFASGADVREPAQIASAVETLEERWGRLDILVNNAGGSKGASILDTSYELWHDMLALNLTAAFLFAQRGARLMARNGYGRIVNVASHSALLGSTNRGAYAAAKGGLVALTRVMAVEFATHNITVNAIAPGPIDVARTTGTGTEGRRQAWMRVLPLQRRGKPADVAALAVFLASEEAGYITGQVVPVDGGFTAAGLMI